ncbi:MAG TPA: hypothetical protein VFV72_03480 [Candidatus Limnocylindrales bacterium]|nr:hypothetical protein [Candidatus Limnocylindrales bacterium]
MPIDFLAFTSDRKISGRIMLADDRLSDMLNAVTRLVIRDAMVDELNDERAPRLADVTIAIGEMLVVVGTGPRGSERLRKKWLKRRASVGIGRFVVEGDLGYPSDESLPESEDPAVVLANRDLLVPLTDATITYDRFGTVFEESYETILFNRSRAGWIDVAQEVFLEELSDDDAAASRTRYIKDFTNTIAD